MVDEKDHFGAKLREKEKAEEDRYFAELSRKQLEKLRQVRSTTETAGTGACPRCGTELVEKELKGVVVDACPKDCGLWLDKGELEQIRKREGDSWLARLLLGARS